ncbi:hypothetical protein B0H13DRAFT_1867392 [Mycena leptocephala]|nr:hypothetical protein B0H13DRAFT_1867392 [Mycena leptocephala]
MPDFEILHSGQYWQTLRRAKATREARRTSQPEYIPGGGMIYTFIPGRAEPMTSMLHRDGSLIPVPGMHEVPSSSACGPASRVRARPKTKPINTNSTAASRAAREDELLLARLAESPHAWEKRKRTEDLAQTERALKKKVYT